MDSLEHAIRGLYRSGIGENSGLSADEVEELLDGIDFYALLQAVRHHAETVFAFVTPGSQSKAFNYRGAELFNQRAALLYDDFDQSTAEAVLTTRSVELWLLEDMTVTAVASVSVVCEGGAYVAEYREDLGDPWAVCGRNSAGIWTRSFFTFLIVHYLFSFTKMRSVRVVSGMNAPHFQILC